MCYDCVWFSKGKENIVKHSIEVPTAKSLQELGTKIAQLRYDALILVFVAFRAEILRQMIHDESKNRLMIAERGSSLFKSITACILHMRKMLMIASPHIQKEIAERPLLIRKDEF